MCVTVNLRGLSVRNYKRNLGLKAFNTENAKRRKCNMPTLKFNQWRRMMLDLAANRDRRLLG